MKSALLAVYVAIVFALTAQPTFSQDNYPRPRLISVSGTAEVNVPPDEVILILAVQSRDRDLSIAKSQHDLRMKKILTETRNQGVEDKYIQTSSLEMAPEYSEERIPKLLGYEVTQTIQVTLKDLSKYDSLLTKLLESGVNRIDGVQFQVAEPRKYREESRLKAIRAAKEKAAAMAAELGQTLGKPWEINEETENYVSPYANYANMQVQVMAGAMAPTPNEPTVAPGQVSIRASVRVSFQLE